MKLLTDYLERAVSLERLAANEAQSEFKKALLHQADLFKYPFRVHITLK